MYLKTLFAAVAVVSMMSGAASAAPTLLTTEVGYTGPGLDLSAFENGMYNFTYGPLAVDGFTFTSNAISPNNPLGSVVGQGAYGLGANGSFDGNPVYIGLDSGFGYAQLLGTAAYNQIGFFFNYAPGSGDDPVISTLDIAGNVSSSFNLATDAPISTPNGLNAFRFRGIAEDTATIYGLRFAGSYILATGTADGSVGGIPEPASWALMIGGFGMAGVTLRYRRRTSTLQS